MSTGPIRHVLDRIRDSAKDSPIAVFKTEHPVTFKAVFGATILTKHLIANKDPDFIGLYDGTMLEAKIKGELRSASL